MTKEPWSTELVGDEANAATMLGYDHADRADDADTLVLVELITDEITISEPTSVALYLREFDRLRAEAAYDEAAHTLIDHIITDLQTEGR